MKFRKRKTRAEGPDLTPLVDVIFQLLVFFLLTSVFVEPGIPLRLPQASTAEASRDPHVNISVNEDGKIFVGETEVPEKILEEYLRTAFAQRENPQVAVRGDEGARYGVLVSVMDASRRAGASDVVLVSLEK